jgi:glycosyltransferase involved in cell wall biosynthesis
MSRNEGLSQTAGDYVIFLDDDIIPTKHLLEAYAGKKGHTYKQP